MAAISKKMRFEVFKRDAFTCQYCGRKAPDAVLQVDHIKPKSKGGTNDILNLVTSCSECNSGKSNRELSDQQVIQQKRKQLAELQERKEQLEMMFEWQQGLLDLGAQTVSSLADIWARCTPGYHLNESGLNDLRKLTKVFSVTEITEAMQIAVDQYLEHRDNKTTQSSVELAWKRVGGICHNRRVQSNNPELKRVYYIRAALRNRLSYCNDRQALRLLTRAQELGADMDRVEDYARGATNWTNWVQGIEAMVARLEHDQ